jgi:SecD/SecF fusion protein
MKKFKPVILIPVLLILLAVLCFYVFQGLTDYKENSSEDDDCSEYEDGIHVTYEITYLNGDISTDQDMEDIKELLTERIASEVEPEGSDEDSESEDKKSDLSENFESILPGNKDAVYKVNWVGSNRIEIYSQDVADVVIERITTTPELYFIREYNDTGSANYYDPYGMGYAAFMELSEGVTIDSLKESGDIVLSAEDIADAQAGIDKSGTGSEYIVELTFTSEGAEKFAAATESAYANGETIGIYYDGAFISVPRVQAVITDGKASITGMGSYESAEMLAKNIRLGNLKLSEVETDSSDTVTDTENSIDTNIIIAIIGIIVIVLILFVFLILGIYKAIVRK